jgi:hypothetical protein
MAGLFLGLKLPEFATGVAWVIATVGAFGGVNFCGDGGDSGGESVGMIWRWLSGFGGVRGEGSI